MGGPEGRAEIPCVGALGHVVQLGADSGMSPAGAGHLMEILGWCFDAFRRTLRGDACERRVNDGVSQTGCASGRHEGALVFSSPTQSTWPSGYMPPLVGTGIIVRTPQAVWASPAMVRVGR